LNVPVLAEGVETDMHLEFATSSGCEEVQGFHFGQPVPEANLMPMYMSLGDTMYCPDIRKWQEATPRQFRHIGGMSGPDEMRIELRSA
jgi:predicted signal transduction protein with EAL and GGDEF domain